MSIDYHHHYHTREEDVMASWKASSILEPMMNVAVILLGKLAQDL